MADGTGGSKVCWQVVSVLVTRFRTKRDFLFRWWMARILLGMGNLIKKILRKILVFKG